MRGLVLLGVIGLLLSVVMSPEHTPTWISNAKLYPLARSSAVALRVLAPKAPAIAANLKPAIDKAVRVEGAVHEIQSTEPQSSAVGHSNDSGYSAAARKGLDDVVEKSR